jgi:hypothetical protein
MKRARAGRRLATVTSELAVTVLTVRRLGINQHRSKRQLALTAFRRRVGGDLRELDRGTAARPRSV